jgi:hypothetical protein
VYFNGFTPSTPNLAELDALDRWDLPARTQEADQAVPMLVASPGEVPFGSDDPSPRMAGLVT